MVFAAKTAKSFTDELRIICGQYDFLNEDRCAAIMSRSSAAPGFYSTA